MKQHVTLDLSQWQYCNSSVSCPIKNVTRTDLIHVYITIRKQDINVPRQNNCYDCGVMLCMVGIPYTDFGGHNS